MDPDGAEGLISKIVKKVKGYFVEARLFRHISG
jgi:hypothetical protein